MRIAPRAELWRWIPGLHPDVAAVLDWVETGSGSTMGRHVRKCERCRRTAERLRLAAAPAPEQHEAVEQMMHHLEARMRAWRSLTDAVEATARKPLSDASARVTGTVELYFGRQTALRIARSARRDAPERGLLPVTTPLFDAFLGRRAAEAIARQIADAAV